MVQKIECIKCSGEKQAGEPRFSNLVKKFGSEEKLRADYQCRDCRPKKVKSVKPKGNVEDKVEDKVRELHKESPEMTYSAIGEKLGIDRRKVSKIINS